MCVLVGSGRVRGGECVRGAKEGRGRGKTYRRAACHTGRGEAAGDSRAAGTDSFAAGTAAGAAGDTGGAVAVADTAAAEGIRRRTHHTRPPLSARDIRT